MLNIIKLKLKNTYKKKVLNNQNVISLNKDFVSTLRDWKNSIYVFNKNNLSLIPVKSRLVNKLIKGYLNSYNRYTEYKFRKDILSNRKRRLSTNKIFISDSEFKHTNDKVSITLYVYNRQKLNYLLKLKNRYLRFLKNRKNKIIFTKKLQLINKVLKKKEEKYSVLKKDYPSLYFHIKRELFIKSLRRLKYYVFLKQLIYINKAKFQYSYLYELIFLIRKLYEKNIEFNIVNLKYFYFNSDIFSQPLVLKLNKKRKLSTYLKTLVLRTNIIPKELDSRSKYFFNLENLNIVKNKDIINNLLKSLMKKNLVKSNNLKKIVLYNIKYKRVSGLRLEASGRLTKRFTASRSQNKSIYRGNLENYYSSIKKHPSVVLRGNYKPNLQYTKLNSKTRIGSFGIKGWISGT